MLQEEGNTNYSRSSKQEQAVQVEVTQPADPFHVRGALQSTRLSSRDFNKPYQKLCATLK
jgi:hypothetical protein